MKLLFVCTHNRCRSILSEAIGRSVLPTGSDVRSAGSSPAGEVFPGTLDYLTSQGIPVDGLVSQSWDEFADFSPDLVITVCDNAAGETCPLWLGNTAKVHWPLPDPSKLQDPDEQAQKFAMVGALIKQRLTTLAMTLPALPDGADIAAVADQILNVEQIL